MQTLKMTYMIFNLWNQNHDAVLLHIHKQTVSRMVCGMVI